MSEKVIDGDFKRHQEEFICSYDAEQKLIQKHFEGREDLLQRIIDEHGGIDASDLDDIEMLTDPDNQV